MAVCWSRMAVQHWFCLRERLPSSARRWRCAGRLKTFEQHVLHFPVSFLWSWDIFFPPPHLRFNSMESEELSQPYLCCFGTAIVR